MELASSVYASDLDGDGDNDVLSASEYDDKIAWYENLGGGAFGSQQIISTQADGAVSVYSCDLDGGGAFDSQQVISTQANSARSVYASDLDGDGDNDVLSASE